jgi:hypothetical protein
LRAVPDDQLVVRGDVVHDEAAQVEIETNI